MVSIYRASTHPGALRQGEVLGNVSQLKRVVTVDTEAGMAGAVEVIHPLAIVLSQDCDLEWDYDARSAGNLASPKIIPSVLFGEIFLVSTHIRPPGGGGMAGDIWKRVRDNKDERYQYLRAVAQDEDALGQGFEETVVDFKRYFTIPTEDVYAQLASGATRRTILCSPYLEHIGCRFYHFQARVALPQDHYLKPP